MNVGPVEQSAFTCKGSEVAQYLTPGRAYVQDERYASGAGMCLKRVLVLTTRPSVPLKFVGTEMAEPTLYVVDFL